MKLGSLIRYALLCLAVFPSVVFGAGQQVRYGDTVQLRHKNSGRYITALDRKYDHSGTSGQFAIAAKRDKASQDSMWLVEAGVGPGDNANEVRVGQVVNRGDTVSFKSITKGYHLHSHQGIKSPASGQGEVTGFAPEWGGKKQGDGNDNWQFLVTPSDAGIVQIKHMGTGWNLHSHDAHQDGGKLYIFNDDALQEVTTYGGRDSNDDWIVEVIDSDLERIATVTRGGDLLDLVDGTIIALQSKNDSPGKGKFLRVEDGKYLKATGANQEDPYCLFVVMREGEWTGLKSLMVRGNNLQSVPAGSGAESYVARFENKNFNDNGHAWEHFIVEGSMDAAFFKNQLTGGYLSVRGNDESWARGKVFTRDHTGGPSKPAAWESLKIVVVYAPKKQVPQQIETSVKAPVKDVEIVKVDTKKEDVRAERKAARMAKKAAKRAQKTAKRAQRTGGVMLDDQDDQSDHEELATPGDKKVARMAKKAAKGAKKAAKGAQKAAKKAQQVAEKSQDPVVVADKSLKVDDKKVDDKDVLGKKKAAKVAKKAAKRAKKSARGVKKAAQYVKHPNLRGAKHSVTAKQPAVKNPTGKNIETNPFAKRRQEMMTKKIFAEKGAMKRAANKLQSVDAQDEDLEDIDTE